MHLLLPLLAAMTSVLAEPPQAVVDAAPPAEDEIVVAGRPGTARPKLSAVEYYRRHCFDSNRLTGRSAAPAETDPDWLPLDRGTLGKLKSADPDVQAFDLVDEARKHTLVLKIERFTLAGGVVESRCTLVIVGGTEHAGLADQLGKLFRGGGTQRHVGHPYGYESAPGWEQWVWTGMPARGSKDWRVPQRRSADGGWLVVTDLGFYTDHDYVLGDLKTRKSGNRPVSMLSLLYMRRPSSTSPRR